ncbi:MAG: hypothetical protein N2578_03830 [Bdellovibrionaceae bacterium]|nr:hypothetical protein [Pseudobdellovibrionaceae bacterium]
MRYFKFAAAALASVALSACGGTTGSSVKNVKLRTYVDQNTKNLMAEMEAEFDSSNVIFPTAYIPVVDPNDNNRPLGVIRTEMTLDGKNMLYITADASRIKLGNFLPDNKLPNGNPIPVAGIQDLMTVPAGKNSKLYLGWYQGKMVLGAAMAVKEFDGLAGYIPGANIFFTLPSDSGVRGVAGFFTGTQSGTSGLGIFAQTNWDKPFSLKSADAGDVRFISNQPSRNTLWKLQYFFWELGDKHKGRINWVK